MAKEGALDYFDLKDDMAGVPDRWTLGDLNADGEDVSDDLWNGLPYVGASPLMAEVAVPGPSLQFSLTSFAAPIVSQELGAAMQALAPEDIQLVDVEVPGHGTFQALVALRLVDCIDDKKSEEVRIWRKKDGRPDKIGQYRSVPGMRLRRDAIPSGIHVFRTSRWEIALVVSAEMRREMLRIGCRGAKFVQVT